MHARAVVNHEMPNIVGPRLESTGTGPVDVAAIIKLVSEPSVLNEGR